MTIEIARGTELPTLPWIPSARRRVWRDVGVLQFGIDPDTAVVIDGVCAQTAAVIDAIDGTTPLEALLRSRSFSPDLVIGTIRKLTRAGLLIDLHTPDQPEAAISDTVFGPYAAEVNGRMLAATPDPPAATLAARRGACVVVAGGVQLTVAVAKLLATAGIGRLDVIIRGPLGVPSDDDAGDPPVERVRRSLRSVAPDLRCEPLGPTERPDLVVLTDAWPGCDERERLLQATGTTYLAATIRERRAVIGPFVIPAQSSCLSCQHLHRRDKDPRWQAIIAQLRLSRDAYGAEAALVSLAAGLATAQALQWIDGERLPETINATLDIALPELLLARRYWPRHGACRCFAGQ